MKRLLLTAGSATLTALALLTGPAGSAHADQDGQFLAQLIGAGLSHRATDLVAVTAGRAVCQLMDQGLSPMDTVTAVQTTNPGFSTANAARFAAISVSSYCPEHL